MKKLILILFIILSLSLSACGNNSTPNDNVSTTSLPHSQNTTIPHTDIPSVTDPGKILAEKAIDLLLKQKNVSGIKNLSHPQIYDLSGVEEIYVDTLEDMDYANAVYLSCQFISSIPHYDGDVLGYLNDCVTQLGYNNLESVAEYHYMATFSYNGSRDEGPISVYIMELNSTQYVGLLYVGN